VFSVPWLSLYAQWAEISSQRCGFCHRPRWGLWLSVASENHTFPEKSRIQPRHAFWWGMPMILVWQESGDSRYLECARRAADWYVHAQRHDGGLLRNTYLDFDTDSFGHETSGIACAAIFWQKMQQATGTNDYDGPTQLALDYCQKVQFAHPADENLRGAILSKVLPPDGSDCSPYHLRDLGTIFFVQAAAMWLRRHLQSCPLLLITKERSKVRWVRGQVSFSSN
jgi:hypothetical protein